VPESRRRRDPKAPAKVFIVDDHPIVRRGIAQLLSDESDLVVCGEADSAEKALEGIALTNPDLAIVDLTLAGAVGLSLIKELRERRPPVASLVLSMHDESLYAERALRAGASGYIMKQEATDHIVEAVRQVLRGEIYLSEKMAARMLHRLAGEEGGMRPASIESLSDRELEVFHLVGAGLATREVAEKLYLSVKTIETHLEHIKTKLGLANGRELVRYAVKWAAGEADPPAMPSPAPEVPVDRPAPGSADPSLGQEAGSPLRRSQ
jgi:DNA-binding NarL/FixJ family response regulator